MTIFCWCCNETSVFKTINDKDSFRDNSNSFCFFVSVSMMNPVERNCSTRSDLNNNEVVGRSSTKKPRTTTEITIPKKSFTVGQLKNLTMINFMCHKNFTIDFHSVPMQIVTGANGSGKSTIANAICLILGAQARTTGRTKNAQSFIQQGAKFEDNFVSISNFNARKCLVLLKWRSS